MKKRRVSYPIKDLILYGLLAFIIAFLQLLPLSLGPENIPPPDFFFVLTMIWVLQNPKSAHPVVIALVTLFLDFCLSRPPGLWTALVLLASEFTRAQRGSFQTANLLSKALLVGGVLGAVVTIYRLIQIAFFLPVAPFIYEVQKFAISVAFIPIAYLVVSRFFSCADPYTETL